MCLLEGSDKGFRTKRSKIPAMIPQKRYRKPRNVGSGCPKPRHLREHLGSKWPHGWIWRGCGVDSAVSGLNTIRTDSAWCSIKYCGHPTSSSVGYRRPLGSQPLCSTRFFRKLSSLDIKRCLEMRPTIPFSPRQNAACRSRATPG